MIKRFQESLLRELLELFPVVAVVGPRQVGKTTLVTSEGIGAGRTYLSLDDLFLKPVCSFIAYRPILRMWESAW